VSAAAAAMRCSPVLDCCCCCCCCCMSRILHSAGWHSAACASACTVQCVDLCRSGGAAPCRLLPGVLR
jgi:hypothetical protein